MSSHALTVPQRTAQEAGEITIDFLFVDLTTCTRCVGTDQSLETALGIVRGVLDATGAAVEVRKTRVETAAQARDLRFVSSPTIRINGRDLAFELKESACGSQACIDGCGDRIACRVWTYRGQEYTEAPVGLIVDAVLGELYGGATRTGGTADAAYELPENLESFFAGKGDAPAEQSSCCSPAEQDSCCEPSAEGGLLRAVDGGRLRMPMSEAGDASLAEGVWRESHDRLLGFIARRVRTPEDAEDILQDVMLRIHRHGGELEQADRVTAWVYRIASNAAADYYRKPARRELPSGQGTDLPQPDGSSNAAVWPEPATAELRSELAGCLAPMVASVPAIYQRALELIEFDGLTQTQAAAQLGISVSGMKTRVQRARGQLKDLLLDCCHVQLDSRGGVTAYRSRRGSCETCRRGEA